jgi:5S rRNA maturation endonuclease (ribonuclease M5)
LSTRLRNKEERLLQILEYLAEESAKGIPIIVEGKKDVEALRTLNIEGSIVSAKSGGKSLLDVISEVEESSPSEVILLLDYDRRGKEWTKRLKLSLENARITPNTTFWRQLFGLVGREVKDVESLVTYMETLKNKISSNS